MRKKRQNLLLFILLGIFIFLFWIARVKDTYNSDYYQLTDRIYLHKLDYFSSYSVSGRENGQFHDILRNVQAIAIMDDGILVSYGKGKDIEHRIYKDQNGTIREIKDTVLRDSLISKLDFKKPWQIVEQKTLSNSNKLLSQVILIIIISIAFYLIMRIFKIKRLTRKP